MSRRSHARQLRKGRHSLTGQIYLVTAVTLHRERVFDDLVLGRLLVGELRRAQEQGEVYSLAWVIMPDHMHWLLELREDDLSQVMRRVKSRSAIAVNRKAGRQGRLWQDGFHDRALRKEENLVHFARYIVANPLRAGLVRSVREYALWDAVWI